MVGFIMIWSWSNLLKSSIAILFHYMTLMDGCTLVTKQVADACQRNKGDAIIAISVLVI